MRFARLQKNSAADAPGRQSVTNRLTLTLYNLAWWVPILLPFTKTIGYRAGTIAFAAIIAIRLAANLYRNNFLPLERAQTFPFRSP